MAHANDQYGSYTASEIKKDASQLAGAAGEQIAETANQVKDVAKQQIDQLSASIRAKPIQAAGIAAGLGFVLALLARR